MPPKIIPTETRVARLEVRDAQVSEDGTRGRFEGYGNVFNALNPYYNERTLPGAYAKTLQEGGRNVPLNYGHDDLCGFIEDAKEDAYGLWLRGAINLETDCGRETWALLKQSMEVGRPMGLSREFRAIQERTGADGAREILEEALSGMALTVYQSMPAAMVTGTRDALAVLRARGITITPEQEAHALRAAGLLPDTEPGDTHSDDDEQRIDFAPVKAALDKLLASIGKAA